MPRRPAEWEPIQAAYVSWPRRPTTWPGRLAQIIDFYVDWIHTIAESTPVRVLVRPNDDVARISSSSNVEILPIDTDDVWIRDYGPQWVWRGRRSACHVFCLQLVGREISHPGTPMMPPRQR